MEGRSTQRCVHRLEFDIEWPPGHVACYLVDGPEPVLVDAGAPDREAAFNSQLDEHGYDVGDVEHVLVTHPHVDHLGLLPAILEAGESAVYAPASAVERLERDPADLATRVRRNAEAAGFPEVGVDQAVEMSVTSLERNAELVPPAAIDVAISPGETVAVGDLTVDAVHAPGHQSDHLCYRTRIDGEHALLAGDAGIRSFRPVALHDGLDDGHREAFDAFYAGLDRLAELDVDRVYPGHGPVHGELDATVDRDRSSLDDRLEAVAGLVADGRSTAAVVAGGLAGERDIRYLVPEAMSALAHLDSRGDLDSTVTDGVRHYEA